LKRELLSGSLRQGDILIVLIISLLAYAKQPAEIRHGVVCGGLYFPDLG
jgi:hypothetical protein